MSVRVLSAGAVIGAGVGVAELYGALDRPGPLPRRLRGFDPTAHVPFRGTRQLCRASQLACVAATEAIAGASDAWHSVAADRRAVAVGTQWGSIEPLASFNRVVVGAGPQQTLPMSFPNVVVNVHAGHVAIFFEAAGPNLTVCGQAAGLEAVIEAVETIELGRADVALAGGTESSDAPVGLADAGEASAMVVLAGADVDVDPSPTLISGWVRGRPETVAAEALEAARCKADEVTWWDASPAALVDGARTLLGKTGDCRAANGALLLVAARREVLRCQQPAIVVASAEPSYAGARPSAVAVVVAPG
jgi:hypothetical protein